MAEPDWRALYEEKAAVIEELRKVIAAVKGADKYSKVIAESLLANLARIEAREAERTRRGERHK